MKFILKNILILVFPAVLTLSSCGKKNSGGQEEEKQSGFNGASVSLIHPVIKNMTEYLSLNANTIFQNQETIRATFAGYVVKTYKNPGDHVKKGDILFLMRTKEASAAGEDTSGIDYGGEKFRGLVKIYSRTDGVLTELDFQAGNYVSEGDKLAVLIEPRSMKIMLNVPFRYASIVEQSGMYDFTLPDGRTHRARVIKNIPSIDPANQTEAFILEPVPFIEIPANLNLTVKIPLRHTEKALALPKSAVVSNETQTEFWVMKAVNDTLALKLDVKKGIEEDSMVQILQPPLNLSDRFIAEGSYGLPDTAKIIIKK